MKVENQNIVRISVRNLVEFIMRNGDIDNRTGTAQVKDAMLMGGRIHRKIQRQMGSSYRAEVSMKTEVEFEDLCIRVEGRADGVIEEDGEITIDEIKGILGELKLLREPVKVHEAQAKCYAWMAAKEKGLKKIGIQITYCQMETEEIKRFQKKIDMDVLEEWFLGLVAAYEKWARFQIEWKKERNASIKKTEFPFAYRPGQKELVSNVYRTILRKKKLFLQAPTGVGKTISTIFPAVKALGENLGEKIFYLTAKTITRTVAGQAFDALRENGLRMKSIVLTAKEKICFLEKADCNPDACPYAKGHYDKVNDAVFELLREEDDLTREVIERQAKKYGICPFEMSLDAAEWVDAVICDYNYAFDPNAHLRRFFGEGLSGEYLFLVDEAHNLVERAREMYSAKLYKEDFLALKREVGKGSPKLAKKLEECNRQMLEWKRECEDYQILDQVSHFAMKLLNLMSEMEKFLEESEKEEEKEKVRELYFQVRMFLYIHERLDENYVIYTQLEESARFKVKLYCVNPAVNLKEYLDMGSSTIFFSATLLPVNYYKKLLSVETDDYAVYAESPFSVDKRLLLVGADVSSKYKRRGRQMYERYAEYICKAARAKKGNYLAFFPSYQFMEEVYDCFEKRNQDGKIAWAIQSQYMNEEAREIFLEEFEEERAESFVGFCVLGGVFSEGIDLTKEKLIGAFIAGTGLPQVCQEREILRMYFEKMGLNGFDYAYLYPGLNKVLQAAGRVIRTEEDEGVIFLLDDRFLERKYEDIFPREWRERKICRLLDVQKEVETFWKIMSESQNSPETGRQP